MTLGIRTQLVLLITASIVLVAVAIGTLFISFQLGSINRDLDNRASELTQELIHASEYYLFVGEVQELQNLATRMLEKLDVVSVEFLDKDKNTLASSSIKDVPNEISRYTSGVYSDAIEVNPLNDKKRSDGILLGYVLLTLSIDDKAALTKPIMRRGIVITFFLVVIGAGVGLWLGYKTSSRLENIKLAVAKLSKGNMQARCREDGTGELLRLQQGINAMAETIEKNESTLKERVAYSTSALKITVHELREKNKQLLVANRQLQLAREEAVQHEREKVLVEERERIMQDMHDGIGGQLVASLAIVENYQNQGIDIGLAYEEIRGLLKDCLDDLRLVIDSLDNSTDKLAVLLGMFRHRTQKRIEAAGVKLKWDIVSLPDSIAFSPHENLHILRIIQEAFTNVIKHANASTLTFSVILEKNEVKICILDNGRSASESKNGRGVTNMRRRAEELKGRVNILQGDSGRRVELYIPVKKKLVAVKESA